MVNTRSNNNTHAKVPLVSRTKKINELVNLTTEKLINDILDSFIQVEILSNTKPIQNIKYEFIWCSESHPIDNYSSIITH